MTRGRAITPDSRLLTSPSLPSDGIDLRVILPANSVLTGVTCIPIDQNTPRTMFRVSVRLAKQANRAIPLIPFGQAWRSVGTNHGSAWTGALKLDPDYESELLARVYHNSGTDTTWQLNAFVEE